MPLVACALMGILHQDSTLFLRINADWVCLMHVRTGTAARSYAAQDRKARATTSQPKIAQ
jgi:hypothetical protein